MTTFLRVVEGLLRDPTERAAYSANPDGYLDDRGFGVFDTGDVEHALVHVVEVLPPTLAASIDPAAGLDSIAAAEMDPSTALGGADPADLFDAQPDTADSEIAEATTAGLDEARESTDDAHADTAIADEEPAPEPDVSDDALTAIDDLDDGVPHDIDDDHEVGDAWIDDSAALDVDPDLDGFDA